LCGVAALHAALCYTDAYTGTLATYFTPVAVGIYRAFFILSCLAVFGVLDDVEGSTSGVLTATRVST